MSCTYQFPSVVGAFVYYCDGVWPEKIEDDKLFFSVETPLFLAWFERFESFSGFKEAYETLKQKLGEDTVKGYVRVLRDNSKDKLLDVVYEFVFDDLVVVITELKHLDKGNLGCKVTVSVDA